MDSDVVAMIALLESSDPSERSRAAERLARLGLEARSAAVGLARACGDDSETVRQWAAAALESLGPPRPDDLEPLGVLAVGENPDAAYWAVTLLGRLEAEAAVPTLIATLADCPNTMVRERAAWALGRIGPSARAALEPLKQAAATSQNPRLERLARAAIERIA